jgi:RNA-binding protein YlmH
MKLEYNLDFINDKTTKSNLKKAISILERAFYNGKETSSFFLDPFEIDVIQSICDKNKIEVLFLGGNENSERKIFLANPYYLPVDSKDYISVLTFSCKDIKHPDVLGALIHLGLDREKIGDIVVKDDLCEFVVLKEEDAFVKYNLSKIKNERIDIKLKGDNILMDAFNEFEEKRAFVSSLRLDNIISVFLNTSRKKAKQIIKARNVKLDFVYVDNPSVQVKEDSLISIRHEGRFQFDSIEGFSKKGNYHISYRKYK